MEEDTRGSREEVDFGAVLKAPIAADSMLLMQREVVPAEGHTAWRGAAAWMGGVRVGGGKLETHIGCDFERDSRSTWHTRCEAADHNMTERKEIKAAGGRRQRQRDARTGVRFGRRTAPIRGATAAKWELKG